MPDYGHDLQFGIFPSPDAAAAERTLELAQLAEVSGLDLVSVQDHPYQGQHLDTWTLLSVIAARTSAIRVAPNVANLPLRSPVILAPARPHARPAQRRPGRARPGSGSLLGRDRGGRRPTSYAEGGGRRPDRGDRHHPPGLGRRHRPRRR